MEAVTNLLHLAIGSESLGVARDHLLRADHELKRMASITRQMLRFHKQSTSQREITAEALIDNVIAIYQGRIANAGVSIHIRHRAMAPVHCFEGEIR